MQIRKMFLLFIQMGLQRKKINLAPLYLFSLGFSFVFIIFGATASVLGKFLLQNSGQLRIAAGLIIKKSESLPCPIDPKMKSLCLKTRKRSKNMYYASVIIFLMASTFTYILPRYI